MNKETLIRLAQPTATLCLAFSIFSLPFLVKAASFNYVEGGNPNNPVLVKIVK
tara:strand:- start:110 stop:268 length:159 start_codon:yes stop_codon:yes gene_type:complete